MRHTDQVDIYLANHDLMRTVTKNTAGARTFVCVCVCTECADSARRAVCSLKFIHQVFSVVK